MQVKRETIKSIVETLQTMREFVIDLPTEDVQAFKQRVSQLRSWLSLEGRCKYKVIKEKDGITSLHCIVGTGQPLEIEHYGIKEVESL